MIIIDNPKMPGRAKLVAKPTKQGLEKVTILSEWFIFVLYFYTFKNGRVLTINFEICYNRAIRFNPVNSKYNMVGPTSNEPHSHDL